MVATPRHLNPESDFNKRHWADDGIVIFEFREDAVVFWRAVKAKGFSVIGGTTEKGYFYIKNRHHNVGLLDAYGL